RLSTVRFDDVDALSELLHTRLGEPARQDLMAERMSAATNRLIFMLWSRDEDGGVAVGELGWSVVCTVRVPLGICLLRWFEGGVCFLAHRWA
ncbi:hypothetical protein, partial [Lactococcus petauri]|uniref:hypothetical protein n=1 Tax=Lactococcus petauri TaxID=1940789 RepID=UPI0021F1E9D6